MSERKLENTILWILCGVLLISLITLILIMNLSSTIDWNILWDDIYLLILKIDVSVSGIAALITAFITLFTLFEIRQQRKKMYEPSLSFMKNNISINKDNEFTDQHFFLHNIGFGTATEVIVEWDYYNKLDRIKEIIPDIDEFMVDLNGFYNKRRRALSKYHDQKQELEDLLPSSINAVPASIIVPKIAIHYFLTIFNDEFLQKKNLNFKGVVELPFLVSYRDINNKSYKKKFILNFKLSSFNEDELFANLFVSRI